MAAYSKHLKALSFCMTVDIIRKAQGKPDPKDFPAGSLKRALAEADVIRDTLRMLGVDPENLGERPQDDPGN